MIFSIISLNHRGDEKASLNCKVPQLWLAGQCQVGATRLPHSGGPIYGKICQPWLHQGGACSVASDGECAELPVSCG